MSDIHALSGAYSINALDEVEGELFEDHLATCPECQAEVDSFRETAVLMAETTSVPPPPALRDRLLADIATVRPLPPVVTSIHSRRRRRFPALVAAAAAVAVIGGGAVVVSSWNNDETSQQQVSATQQVIRASDAKKVELSLDDGADATLVRSASMGKAVLITKDMPAAPTGKVYQMWLQNDAGAMVPAGLMPKGPDQEVLLEGDAGTATAVGITVEPAGGSSVPTTNPIALFDFKTEA